MDLKVTFTLFYGPDFLYATNKSMREKSVSDLKLASPVKCGLVWDQVLAHVSLNNQSFNESIFTLWYTFWLCSCVVYFLMPVQILQLYTD